MTQNATAALPTGSDQAPVIDYGQVLDGIARSIEMTGRIVPGIAPDQLTAPTPCSEWAVRDVLNHTVGGMQIFAAELAGKQAPADHESDWLGSDPVEAYAEAAELDVAAWRDPQALAGTVTISLGTLPAAFAAVIHLVEILVHGIDLAAATDQLALVDEELCERVLGLLVGMGGVDAFRAPGIFGAEVSTDEGAPAHRRLSGYLGRVVAEESAAR